MEPLQRLSEEVDINVRFEGHVSRDELYRYYSNADILVLPSKEEVWGLVVNEALACGTPAIVSTECGCAPDLIREGFNGDTFTPTDPDPFINTITPLLEETNEYADADAIRQDALDRFGMEKATNAFVSACQTASRQYK
jgi:glycosyltransferase involved in cell wall biosynthesis